MAKTEKGHGNAVFDAFVLWLSRDSWFLWRDDFNCS